jgi:transcriptional regulator with GAF, ATPase, and Fis domain
MNVEEELRRQRKTIQLLTDFEDGIGQLQVHRIIGVALDFVEQRLDVSRVSIALLEEDQKGFRLLDVRHDTDQRKAGIFLPFGSTVLSEVVKSTKPVYRNDLRSTGSQYEVDDEFIAFGLKSDFLVPLIVEGECIGTLNAASQKTDGVSEEDRIVLALLAPRLAQALKNARLFEAIQNAHEELEQLVGERTAELASANENLREEIEVRKKAETELKKTHDELEQRVSDRTAEIGRLKDRLQAENTFLKEELDGIHTHGDIVGESPSLKNVIKQIQLVAPTDANVLILGESGTGKELVAREIHEHSLRRDRPMIKVNCATIPKELYESEFFGHVKGAFTGATRDRVGRFEAADGGTLFLDEVGEIPLDLQSKLLRVLQEGEYERVGEAKTRKVDVRIVTATNRDLKQDVENKRFREPLLANHFLDHVSKRLNRPRPRLTQANLIDLQSYDWPGNVRELHNTIERALILSQSGALHFELPGDNESVQSGAPRSPGVDLDPPAHHLTDQELRELEKENIRIVLSHSEGRIYGPGGAAELLGIKPTTLISRMKIMGIQKPSS